MGPKEHYLETYDRQCPNCRSEQVFQLKGHTFAVSRVDSSVTFPLDVPEDLWGCRGCQKAFKLKTRKAKDAKLRRPKG